MKVISLFIFFSLFLNSYSEENYENFELNRTISETTLESFNKKSFKFNEFFYKFTFYPVYDFFVNYLPIEPIWIVKTISQNYINTPSDIILSFLDLDLEAALISFWRFAINSTFGVFGVFDIASEFGLRTTPKSLDMILEKFGIPEGDYFVLPFFGPCVARSILNDVFKISSSFLFLSFTFGAFTPIAFGSIFNYGVTYPTMMITTTSISLAGYLGFNFNELQLVKNSSFDYYQSLKSWYLQLNRANIQKNKEANNKKRLISKNEYDDNNYLFKSDLEIENEDIEKDYEILKIQSNLFL